MWWTMKNEFCHLSLSSIQEDLGLRKQKVGVLPRNPSFGTEKRVVCYRQTQQALRLAEFAENELDFRGGDSAPREFSEMLQSRMNT